MQLDCNLCSLRQDGNIRVVVIVFDNNLLDEVSEETICCRHVVSEVLVKSSEDDASCAVDVAIPSHFTFLAKLKMMLVAS